MTRVAAIAAAALLLVAAVGLVLLGSDALRWNAAFARDDLRFETAPHDPRLWARGDRLAFGTAGKLLAVEDDVAYRRALALFRLGRPREPALLRPHLVVRRAEAAIELGRLAQRERDPRRRSRLANLLGVLAIAEPRDDVNQRISFLQAGAASFQGAIRLDASNEDAKFNLELALRRLRNEGGQSEVGRLRGRLGATGAGLGALGSGY